MEFLPASSYSFLVIHIFLKVARLARMEPPIQVEMLHSHTENVRK